MRLNVILQSRLDAELSIRKTITRRAARGKDAMEESAEMILSEAKEIAPEKSGDLRASGRVEMSEGFVGVTEAFIIFGNSVVDYAAMHEHWRTDEYVSPTLPGTLPHFLALGFKAAGGSTPVTKNIARAIGRR